MPPLHTKPGSIEQLSLHPSPLIKFPSSHVSDRFGLRLPLPHSSVHIEGSKVHLYPSSIIQSLLQPSPLTLFPSSQLVVSDSFTIPSPHTIKQVSAVVIDPPPHEYPSSIIQVLSHPSLSNKLPSSHSSVSNFNPSPHSTLQVVAGTLSEFVVQLKPCS